MIDTQIRAIYNCQNKILWKAYVDNDTYGWYYAESRVYLIRNMKTDVLSIVAASNPSEALEKVLTDGIKDRGCYNCRHKNAHSALKRNGNVPMCCIHCMYADDLHDKWEKKLN